MERCGSKDDHIHSTLPEPSIPAMDKPAHMVKYPAHAWPPARGGEAVTGPGARLAAGTGRWGGGAVAGPGARLAAGTGRAARAGRGVGYQMSGWRGGQGRACSSWAERSIRVASSALRAASMTPMGRPSAVQYSGTFTAGWPDTL